MCDQDSQAVPSNSEALWKRLKDDSTRLLEFCEGEVTSEEAGVLMREFMDRDLTEAVGARIFVCLLKLTGRDDGAQFWWQFAAGAGDGIAASYLACHHAQHGEVGDALHWWEEGFVIANLDHEPAPDVLASCVVIEVRELPDLDDDARRRIGVRIVDTCDDDLGDVPLPQPATVPC